MIVVANVFVVVVGRERDNNITARRVTSKKWTKKPRLHYCLDTSASFFDNVEDAFLKLSILD